MHPNPAFRGESTARNLEFARARGFGVLAVAAEGAPLISHVPFLLNPDGDVAELHLVRSNPIVRLLSEPVAARLAVSGPDSYVSPDWYGVEEQVPTWNYVAVHLVGRLELRPQEEMRGLLDRLSAEFEGRLTPKAPWVADKMQPEGLARMMRMIVPCRLQVEDVKGTWKLGQNKPDAARMGAAEAMEDAGVGSEFAALAALMRAVS
ncbi:FMN-binding negative transcriptional regulator [Ruegeria sp. WL0004]|uniref:FMN-binding negative transcriptional regulator n=1 Tax=Ruegeria marisflavi TaxID=2984152 RepID=A0ABT2WUL6_9RHOB|nr:FMN-binding negative transcriptional regulator [Ruegeria sp. WL0004]MCU9839597.1 FMN-binding negative transcriptional regulator [Ruegeria sp. WL0004]